MTQQKDVVDLKKELGVGANNPTQPKAKTFRFKKIRFPVQPVKLGDGQTIEFRTIKLGTGGQSKYGIFETTDPKLAEQLRAAVKAGTRHIFEV